MTVVVGRRAWRANARELSTRTTIELTWAMLMKQFHTSGLARLMNQLCRRARRFGPRCIAAVLGLLILLPATPTSSWAAEPTVQQFPFRVRPNWDGFRNRLHPEKLPKVRQNFGYRDSNLAGGKRSGEIGGFIQRATTTASYAKAIPTVTLNDPLSASGTFAVTADEGSSGMLIGWFHERSRGWRTPNSLAFRVDGNGGKYWLFYEYGTRNWSTGGAGAYEGLRYQTTKTKPFPADGTVHHWELTYDPNGPDEEGVITFTVDGRTWNPLPVPLRHKKDGAEFNRFGLFNQQVAGGGLEIYMDDITVNGQRYGFDSNPDWQAVGNAVEFEERIVRPYHNFGFSPTSHAGGESGEIGGIIFRDEKPSYYGAPVAELSLDDRLAASGKLAFLAAGSDSGVLLGFFNSRFKRANAIPDHKQKQPDYLAIMIEGPSRVGHYFRAAYVSTNREGAAPTEDPLTGEPRPVIKPDGRSHNWSLDYSPTAAKGAGRITVTLDGETHSLDLQPAHRQAGATFDRFGLFNIQAGGHHIQLYVDDVSLTTGNGDR